MIKISKQNLYFIALIPPQPIEEEIFAMKKQFAKDYNAKAALRSPPHITLHMPFKMTDDKIALLENRLQNMLGRVPTLTVNLDGFGAFPPRVIFLKVVDSIELTDLHQTINNVMRKEFKVLNQNYKDRKFHPHLTLAFRDLRKWMFKEAWEKYSGQEWSQKFTCDTVTILKHNGKFWEMKTNLKLAN